MGILEPYLCTQKHVFCLSKIYSPPGHEHFSFSEEPCVLFSFVDFVDSQENDLTPQPSRYSCLSVLFTQTSTGYETEKTLSSKVFFVPLSLQEKTSFSLQVLDEMIYK
ncbi:hypothetical protein I79_012697 [Cricetulus griseus]|uniref:Uncharacterized protein n=1 Tax=Cricetulus griseus TaxID=10029 RepID=G3HPI4_CRIGR|nr:hypothetical protein I79_012697 [Cricetulus griseus]